MQTAKDSNSRSHIEKELQVEDGRGELYRRATIDVLPDDVLLDVFDFYLDLDRRVVDAWHKLVHVCRRWRQLVFASPCRLNLRLLCTNERPVETLLDIWPELPIVIQDHGLALEHTGTTNIDAALEHNDRICKISIDSVPSSFLQRFVSIKKPFPALTFLDLRSYDTTAPILPNSFLDGSAPRLRSLTLSGIPFWGLPMLLLSSHHLVHLSLLEIPDLGYIPPNAMVTCLSLLTGLQTLVLGFWSHRSQSYPHQTNRHQPPLTRAILPSLTSLSFKGVSEYLEVTVARIDIPLLNDITIIFFDQPIFDTPLLRSFIGRAEAFKAPHRAEFLFSYNDVHISLLREGRAHDGALRLGISSNGRLSSMAQVCNSSLPPFPTLEHLYIREHPYWPHWQDNTEDTQWLELFRPFITVKSLYLDRKLAPRVAPALLSVEKAEVLPALQNLFVEGPVQPGIAQFIATRQLLGHSVAVQDWDRRHEVNR